MAELGLAARIAAIEVLGAVLGDGMMLRDALAAGSLAALPAQDRARAQRLALAVLRRMEQADRVLAPHLRKSPPLFVLNALRLGAVEMAEGAAPHGAVNGAVEAVRRGGPRTASFAGLTNAVLRKVTADAFAPLPPQRMPRWLRQPLVARWGRPTVEAMEAVQAAAPPMDLSLKPGAPVPEGHLLPTGSLRLADRGQITALPGYAEGHWWVQDAGAAMAVRMLDPQPGERVLDLCAAPGGKTAQIAGTGARVTAVDISGPRMARVAENLARLGLSADLVVADGLQWEGGTFDAVLIDAPCSASGTLRRHPDLAFVKDGSDLAALGALQAALIDRALGMVAPGGRLVICTCSLLAAEGEDQLAALLARNDGLRVVPPSFPGVEAAWITPEGALRLRPDHWADIGGMDGFFVAEVRPV